MSTSNEATQFTPDVYVTGQKTLSDVNTDISAPLERFPNKIWWVCFITAICVFLFG